MSSNDDSRGSAVDFPSLIGSVSIAYNRVQHLWLMLFRCYLLGDGHLAKAMFEALRNDASQRDIIIAAASVALASEPKLLNRTQELMKQTNDLSAERNAAVHTFWDQEVFSGKIVATRAIKKHGKLSGDASEQFTRVLHDLGALYNDLLALSSVTIVALASNDRYLEPPTWPEWS